ncbi:MAG: hypothetical protein MK101_08405 [Phycisphaerales bacterium]|nr:hypothetical protein [Phycisphaerales bacterium]
MRDARFMLRLVAFAFAFVLAGCSSEPDGRISVRVEDRVQQSHVSDWHWTKPDGFWIGRPVDGPEVLASPADAAATATINWYMARREGPKPDSGGLLFPSWGPEDDASPSPRASQDQEQLDHDLYMLAYEETTTAQQVQALLDKGADPNANSGSLFRNEPVLLIASGTVADPTVLKALLEAGADASATDEDGRNAIGVVVLFNDTSAAPDMIRVLSEGGVDVNEENHRGDTPLDVATLMDRSPGVTLALIESGAHVKIDNVLDACDNEEVSGSGADEALLAAIDPVQFGAWFTDKGLKLRVETARIGVPQLEGGSEGADEMLIIRLGIKNTDQRRILRMESSSPRASFDLIDDVLNVIRGPIHYGWNKSIEGELSRSDDILPGDSAFHTVCFEIPPPMTKSLYLVVNLDLFGRSGSGVLQLPVDQIEGFQQVAP